MKKDPAEDIDNVNHPPHYTGPPCDNCGHPIECINIVEHMPFTIGNAIKYLWRAGRKGARYEDIEKAIWYLKRELQNMEVKSDNPS